MESSYVQYEFYARVGDLIEVSLSEPGTIQLLDDENYRAFVSGLPFHVELTAGSSPMRIGPPHEGDWHVVITGRDGQPVPGSTARLKRAGR